MSLPTLNELPKYELTNDISFTLRGEGGFGSTTFVEIDKVSDGVLVFIIQMYSI